MKWDKGHTSNDVEDRRSEGGAGLTPGGGGPNVFGILRFASMFGWKGVVVGLVIVVVIGGARFLGGGGSGHSRSGTVPGQPVEASPEEEELAHFVGFVFDDIQASWRRQLPGYEGARLVLFRNAIRSACGVAGSAVGPFYCANDNRVYIDLSFYQELRRKLGAPGDFAQAYVIAHEVGHHVQNLRGTFGGSRGDSIPIELQADCLAGAWAQDAAQRGLLEVGDIDEALNAASQIGDDTLQKKAQGHVQPETWTHGSSAQRVASFRKGYQAGAPACGR